MRLQKAAVMAKAAWNLPAVGASPPLIPRIRRQAVTARGLRHNEDCFTTALRLGYGGAEPDPAVRLVLQVVFDWAMALCRRPTLTKV